MISNKSNIVGPRALFDPNYIPPKLLFRKKEENALFSILNDGITDDFSLNILYQGIQGIGKKVIVNKVLKDLSTQHEATVNFYTISIDCKEKSSEEILISLISELNKFTTSSINFNSILNSKSPQMWKTFITLCKKVNKSIIIILNNTEALKSDLYKKLLHLKDLKVTLISTINKILRPSSLEVLSEFDLKKKLEYFTYKELLNILDQRLSLTFSHEINREVLEFISDLIFEHYVPVPGKGIDILREIYPYIKSHKNIEHHKMLEICQNEFDSYQSDEFSMLTYISEEELLIIIFLDNLSNYFLKNLNYYISSDELKELYDISCESLEYEKDLGEFIGIIQKIQQLGILSNSKKSDKEKTNNTSLTSKFFFMNINPYQLNAMVDSIFNSKIN